MNAYAQYQQGGAVGRGGLNRGEIGWILGGIGWIGQVQGGGGSIFTKTENDA